MEPRPLTTWEQKERDGLLALETEEWRQKRLIAENPNTTAETLTRLVEGINTVLMSKPPPLRGPFQPYDLTIDALVLHPNTPPKYFLTHPGFIANTALCRNPAAPFLGLEIPDFWAQMTERMCVLFLADEALPVTAARMFSHNTNEWVAQEARLHIALAGEISSRNEGLAALTNYWREFCLNPKSYGSLYAKEFGGGIRHAVPEWHAELVRFGLAPVWAAPREPFQKRNVIPKILCHPMFYLWPLLQGRFSFFASLSRPSLKETVRQFVLAAVVDSRGDAGEFAEFAAMLHGVYNPFVLQHCLGRERWWERLIAAFRLPLSGVPFKNDECNRSPLDLMHHLAHDGNRFVRWAAQTRLADPKFVFTWHEGE